MSVKVVYNDCFGGFALSLKATEKLAELGVEEAENFLSLNSPYANSFPGYGILRHDPRLVKVVEELGEEANGLFSQLKIAVISGNQYIIDEYDGVEFIKTPNDINWIKV